MDNEQQETIAAETATSSNSEKTGNRFLTSLKSLGSLLGRGIAGVLSNEAPSGPPTENEKKALKIEE